MIDAACAGIILLALSGLYMLIFGTISLAVYLKLIQNIFLKGSQKNDVLRLIDVLIKLSILPSINLFLFLLFSLFDSRIFIFAGIPKSKSIQELIFGLAFTLLWFMPAVFLIIKRFIIDKKYYIKLSVVWYGVIMLCLTIALFDTIT